MSIPLGEKTKARPKQATTPLEKLREQCMKRGVNGIKRLGRAFKIFDDDGNKQLDQREFIKGLNDYGVSLSKQEKEELFQSLDKDRLGSIDFDEFLAAVRPPMSKNRIALIEKAFAKLDVTGDGVVTVEDLKGIYQVKNHPKFKNGEWTEEQCLSEFLKNFDSKEKDGKVTFEEFVTYYESVSVSIDSDLHFDLMMRKSWAL